MALVWKSYLEGKVVITKFEYENHFKKHFEKDAWILAEKLNPNSTSLFTLPSDRLHKCIEVTLNHGKTWPSTKKKTGEPIRYFKHKFNFAVGYNPRYNTKCYVILIVVRKLENDKFSVHAIYPELY